MHWLTMLCLLIVFGMIYGLGHWIWKICQRQAADDQERGEIRDIAETAASDAASCAAVIDKLDILPQRRRLRVVTDKTRGVSTWNWE